MLPCVICRALLRLSRMSTESKFDLIILGGGCAGLSLAQRLSQAGQQCPKVLIIESRSCYQNDRTWCFFAGGTTQAQDLVRYSWPALAVTHGQMRVEVACQDNPYQMIEAETFYIKALEQLAENQQVTLKLGCEVLTLERQATSTWCVNTRLGVFEAPSVIDTRPVANPIFLGPQLWQSFYGQVVQVEQDCFDPTCVEFMRFDPDTEYGVSFTYLLPFNKRQALIETTVFCSKPVEQVTLTARLQSVVDRMLPGQSVSLQRQEYAVLPMGVIHRARPELHGLVRVGLTAGAARPSSGYAFQRIQHWATLCAKSILVGGPVLAHAKEPWLARSMDSLFLRVLRQHPEQGPTIFMAMFKNMRIARIVRFMNDEATWLDRFLLIKSMPLWVFLTQVPFALFRRP